MKQNIVLAANTLTKICDLSHNEPQIKKEDLPDYLKDYANKMTTGYRLELHFVDCEKPEFFVGVVFKYSDTVPFVETFAVFDQTLRTKEFITVTCKENCPLEFWVSPSVNCTLVSTSVIEKK